MNSVQFYKSDGTGYAYLQDGPVNLPASNVIGDFLAFTGLPAGDWDFTAIGEFNSGTASGITRCFIAVTINPGNTGAGFISGDTISLLQISPTPTDPVTIVLPSVRISVIPSMIVYFKVQCTYVSGQPTIYGRISGRKYS